MSAPVSPIKAVAIICELARHGIGLRLNAAGNVRVYPKGVLTDELRTFLKQHEPTLILHLKASAAMRKPASPASLETVLADAQADSEPQSALVRIRGLLISEWQTYHHAEEIAARLRLDPKSVRQVLLRLETPSHMLERQEVRGAQVRAVRGSELVEVEATYFRVCPRWAEKNGLSVADHDV